MDKDQTQSIDDRVRGLIREAVGKIAGDKKTNAVDEKTSPSTCGVERGSLTRKGELPRRKPSHRLENSHDAADHDDIDIYGAHPRDD